MLQNPCHGEEEEYDTHSGWKARTWVFNVDFKTNAVWIITETVSVPRVENTMTRMASTHLYSREEYGEPLIVWRDYFRLGVASFTECFQLQEGRHYAQSYGVYWILT